MDIEAMLDIDRCLVTAALLKGVVKQDSAEMEECTKGEVLAAYQDAAESAISLLDRIQGQLRHIRDKLAASP